MPGALMRDRDWRLMELLPLLLKYQQSLKVVSTAECDIKKKRQGHAMQKAPSPSNKGAIVLERIQNCGMLVQFSSD